MPKFRKKPVVIEAVQWDGANTPEIAELAGTSMDKISSPPFTNALIIKTLEGDMRADQGDWIIKGVQGEFYPCKPDVFEQTYEPI